MMLIQEPIFIENKSIKEAVTISNSTSFIGTYIFQDCTFLETVTLTGDFIQKISFSNCVFESGLVINKFKSNNDVKIIDCNIIDNLMIQNSSFNGFFKIESLKTDWLIPLMGTNCHFEELAINQSSIKYFQLIGNELSGNIKINETKIETFHLERSLDKVNLLISSIKVNQFIARNVFNVLRLQINNIMPYDNNNSFTIQNSELNNTVFMSINFDNFDNIDIRDSLFYNAQIINCIWTKELNLTTGKSIRSELNKAIRLYEEEAKVLLNPPLEDNANIVQFDSALSQRIKKLDSLKKHDIQYQLENNKENYRQLKLIFQKQGDKERANHYFAKEMNVHKLLTSNIIDKVLLYSSDFFSSYGQSITKPFRHLLVHLILFGILILTFNYTPVYPLQTIDYGFSNILNELLYLFNPIRKLEPTNWLFVDILMRINTSYFIYNFLRASRRFIGN